MNKEKALKRINPSIFKGVCHRGLHNEKITENSIEAFKNALNHNLAIELDVHLSKDNNLIVMHDASLKRTTSKEGIIENLTLQEIKDNYRLLNGETVPTLQEVLSLVSEKVPLVIELKPYKQNYKALANRLKEELKDMVFEFKVKSGKEGRVFGSVSTKQIHEALCAKGIKIDKRKILDTAPITSLGTTIVKVELYKNVIGEIKCHLSANE